MISYVPKFVPVQAVKYEEKNKAEIIELLKTGTTKWKETKEKDGFKIGTKTFKYDSNYWIIKNANNECSLIEDKLFQKTYETYERKNHIVTITIDEYEQFKQATEDAKNRYETIKRIIYPLIKMRVPEEIGQGILEGKFECEAREYCGEFPDPLCPQYALIFKIPYGTLR